MNSQKAVSVAEKLLDPGRLDPWASVIVECVHTRTSLVVQWLSLLCNVGDIVSIPGAGRFYTQWSN